MQLPSSVDIFGTGITTPDEFAHVWPNVEPMLARALAPGETTTDMLKKLLETNAQLWAVFRDKRPVLVMVTEIVTRDNRKLCNIWSAAGRGINEFIGYMEQIETWARMQGCEAMLVERGRPGWQRIMKNYKVTHVTLEKEL